MSWADERALWLLLLVPVLVGAYWWGVQRLAACDPKLRGCGDCRAVDRGSRAVVAVSPVIARDCGNCVADHRVRWATVRKSDPSSSQAGNRCGHRSRFFEEHARARRSSQPDQTSQG